MVARVKRLGVTLIEAVLFIAIALGLIVGGLVFFQQAQTASRTTEATRLLSALIAEARANNLVGTPDIPDVLVAMGAVPSGARLADNPHCIIQSPWGHCIIIHSVTDYLEFWLYGMPPELCSRLAHFDASGNGPIASRTNAAGIKRDPNGPAPGQSETLVETHKLASHGALSPAAAGVMCSALTGDDQTFLMISFYFK
jgi:hypothetical protein